MDADTTPKSLQPPPYLQAILDYLKREEGELWNWFARGETRDGQADAVRLDLLKSTYRLDRDTQPELYERVDQVAAQLNLDVPITLYQSQHTGGLNAGLAYLPGQAHLVLHGPITDRLTGGELAALMGHELTHFLLWENWDGEYRTADQILAAMTHDARAEPAHLASARLFGLYSEIFCDRGSLFVTGDPAISISMLVKIQTGLTEVSAESYLRQAEEIFRQGATRTDELTHPESYIRARALKLWADGDADVEGKIAEMIEGQPALEELDLLGQTRVASLTRRLITLLLREKWLQTDPLLAHARLFFDDFAPASGDAADDPQLAADLATSDANLRDYYCYVLLDFVTADRDLEQLPLAAALVLVQQLDLAERFGQIAMKELRLGKRQFARIDRDKRELLAGVSKVVEPQ